MMVPPRLVELVAEKRIVPFIGAGFSVPSGLPGWQLMTQGLIRSTVTRSDAQLLERIGDVATLVDVAELLDSLVPTGHATLEYLRERFDSPRLRPNAYHSALLDLDLDTVVTTNWDRLLELSYEDAHTPAHVIYRESDVSFYEPSNKVQILKLHGTISDTDSLVYRKGHYEQYWKQRELLFSLVSVLAATRGFLFVGYGFGDPNFLELLEKLQQRLGATRREHYALTYGDIPLGASLRRLGIVPVAAPGFDPVKKNYETSTLAALQVLGAGAKSQVTGNIGRAMMINEEIERVTARCPPVPALRMRGALGWLSNPAPISDDPVYGSPERDAVERRMTELLEAFLIEIPNARVRCILHIEAEPLLAQYQPRHVLRRLKEMLRVIADHPGQIEIAHDELPSQLNEMLFDEMSALLGFRHRDVPGIGRVWFTRNRHVVHDRIRHFDSDFEGVLAANKLLASHYGINVESPDWSLVLIKTLINEQTTLLDRREVVPDRAAGVNEEAVLERVAAATAYAVLRHSEVGQMREDRATPFGVHPLRVIERLRVAGERESDVLAAAALHDVVEDCDVSFEELTERFGSRVAQLVRELTRGETQTFSDYLDQLRRSSREAKAIKLSDRLDNVREMRLFGVSTFGDMPVPAYLEQSQEVLATCQDGSQALAAALGAEITQSSAAEQL